MKYALLTLILALTGCTTSPGVGGENGVRSSVGIDHKTLEIAPTADHGDIVQAYTD
jgi:hypothetical protein